MAFPKIPVLGIEGLDWLKNSALAEDRIEKARGIKQLADEMGISMVKFSLAWCLKNPNVSTVILGASKVSQLKENLQAIDAIPLLTPEILEKIETILNNKPILAEF